MHTMRNNARKAAHVLLGPAIVVAYQAALFGVAYAISQIHDTVGPTPIIMLGFGALFGTLAGHFRENLVRGHTKKASFHLTVTRASHSRQLPSLVLRATEWAALAVAATGVTAIVDKIQ